MEVGVKPVKSEMKDERKKKRRERAKEATKTSWSIQPLRTEASRSTVQEQLAVRGDFSEVRWLRRKEKESREMARFSEEIA